MKKIKYFSLIITFIAVSSIIGPMPNLGNTYLIAMLCLLIGCVFFEKHLSVNLPMLCIVIAGIFSILINHPPAYFRSWERLGLFILVAGVVSPLFQNNSFFLLRKELFKWLLKISVIITALSFIGYFFKINYTGSEMSHFGGLTIHSMILAPIASISLCYSMWLAIHKMPVAKKKYLAWIIAGVSLLTILLAASRGALVAVVVACLFLVFKLNEQRIGHVLKVIAVIAIILSVSFPLWDSYTSRIVQKQQGNIEMGGTTASRDVKWDARINEFKSSPFFGVGYAAVSENSGDEFNQLNGQVEPGSSWLAVLSMLGICGFIPFAWLFGNNLFFLYKDNNIRTASLLGSILVFFMVHMLVEGYVFGGGGFMFFMLWLTIGAVVAYRETNNSLI